jgi:hypothetical protein
MTALQGWIVIGLLVLITLGMVGKTCRTYGVPLPKRSDEAFSDQSSLCQFCISLL